MSTLEIVGGIVLLIVSVLVIILCLSQEQKSQDSMSAALTGASTDSFYGKNEGRTKEAILNKITRTLGILMFIIVLAINIIPIVTK
ncbi:MAG: preprotein translocase subunit SecG [Ruminococcus sp.]|nr:preprotein translocase subunit SecG [Ruminococcus sp.]HRR76333.1 preprotein translocase subunit SecG [Ruminococcus sp.]